jgi:nucleotide-binding universal stress UspA family protein
MPTALATSVAIKNVLFATDFTPVAQSALSYAAAVARRFDSRVFVAHVLPPEAYHIVPPAILPAAYDLVRKRALQQLVQAASSRRLQGIPHEVLLAEGDIAAMLLSLIAARDIDLVVIGTHGRKGIERFVLGSVAEELFRAAPCPVIIVGPAAEHRRPQLWDVRHVLFATDFSAPSLAALPHAIGMAEEFDARLTLMHLVHPDIRSASERFRIRQKYENDLRALVAESHLPVVEVIVEFAPVAQGILEFACKQAADLIVLGVRGGGPLARAETHLPGASAFRVVAESHCPVLTVRG